MKPIFSLLAPVIAVMLAGSGPASADSPRMACGNARELWLSGDFDGNTRADVAVLDRATGLLRAGYAQGDGSLVFTAPVSCGGTGVTWALAASLTVANRDQLVVFAPAANRLQLLGLQTPGTATIHPIFSSGSGPRTGAAMDLAGPGNTPALDLMVHGEFTTLPGMAGHLRGLRNTSGEFTLESELAVTRRMDHAAAMVPASGQAAHVGWLRRDAGSSAFEFRSATIAAFTLLDQVAGLPEDAAYACGMFDADRLDFFFFASGQATALVHRLDDTAVPGQWRFGAGRTVDFGAPVEVVTVVRDANSASALLVVFQDGSAALAGYSATSGFGTLQAMPAGSGGLATGGLALANGQFLVLTGPGAGAASTGWRTYGLSGGIVTLLDEGTLPALATSPGGSNVLLFGAHPFRVADAPLLGAYHIYDWTTGADLVASPGRVVATGLRYVDGVTGLGGEQSTLLAEAPAGTTAALVNQYHPQISITRTDTPVGALAVDVSASPSGGQFDEMIDVALTATPASATIVFRTQDGPFAIYEGPIRLTRDTTIGYYAFSGGISSPLRSATYRFAAAPGNLDADGDGVPDFVEAALGLDASGGSDHDGDGFSDLEELLQDTDPADAGDMPASHPDLGDSLTLRITPRPFDFLSGAGSTAGIGTEVRARSTSGNQSGMRRTGHDMSHPYRADVICSPISPEDHWLTLATPFHHGMTTAAADKLRGREIVGVIPVPTGQAVEIDFTYDPANPAAQPAAWIAAAKAAYAGAARPPVAVDLDILHSLRLVLTEHCLARLMSQRGDCAPGSEVCLTPFRQPDALRDAVFPDATALAALERPSSTVPMAPAIILRGLLDGLDDSIRSATPDAGIVAMQNLTTEIYRISAQFHNDAPGELPLPLDALRITLRNRALPEYYASRSAWLPAQITAACDSADAIAASPPGIRQPLTLTLEINDAAPDCTTATDVVTHTTFALLTATGSRFELPEGWVFRDGTRITVAAYAGATPCHGHPTLWVLQSAFDTVVLPGRNDSDGDLLDDTWELFHFGHLGHSRTDDPLATGYSLGEEFFSRTDPNDPADLPAGSPVDLAFSSARITLPASTTLRLTTTWPAAYSGEIDVLVFHSSDLNGFTDTGITATHVGGGQFVAEFPMPAAPKAFYQLRARLKPAP